MPRSYWMESEANHESLSLIVSRARGLSFLRPEKAWRPIVTIDFDQHPQYEICLGCNGENPNQKAYLPLKPTKLDSKLEVRVWHKPPSKKKRKTVLVASTSVTLKELVNRQHPRKGLDVRLSSCRSGTNVPRKGQHPTSASITLKLLLPSTSHISTAQSTTEDTTLCEESDGFDGGFSDKIDCTDASVEPADDCSQTDHGYSETHAEPEAQIRRRRRKPRGYKIFTSDESCLDTDGESSMGIQEGNDLPGYDEDEATESDLLEEKALHPPPYSVVSFIAARILPQYSTDQFSVQSSASFADSIASSSLSLAQSTVSSFSFYTELRGTELTSPEADEAVERVLGRLRTEWSASGMFLIALATLAVTVFGFSPDSISPMDSFSKRAVAAASVSSGVGLCIDALYIVRYHGVDAERFRQLALDSYGTYFFFCLTSRVPALCLIISASSLMFFLVCVAYEMWSSATLTMLFFFGLVMGLNYIVWIVHQSFKVLVRAPGYIKRQCVRLAGFFTTRRSAAPLVAEPGPMAAHERPAMPTKPAQARTA
ncbi:hypothetical protein PUNSTDRAFT_124424 [Punctularia strigosozonata HHB-11173 SS5]|uniref:uncharacterized protein n=1 Tax=Punctularia strigosozonata (strain HHB-11173) TaxID=741275 RepID=UPI00044175C8|nr:uncharacterized protein PUNSTDRAFT_124424 [Punctularia strigosozonata HHB-11173 SS5]EIN12693.1 hypothetical protein PUNSTDRAFT_124424 [Punctularia strigosozonata HHB-11173 SS5]